MPPGVGGSIAGERGLLKQQDYDFPLGVRPSIVNISNSFTGAVSQLLLLGGEKPAT